MTKQDFINECERDAAIIYVRVQDGAHWTTKAFNRLSLEQQNEFIEKWWLLKQTPYKIGAKGR